MEAGTTKGINAKQNNVRQLTYTKANHITVQRFGCIILSKNGTIKGKHNTHITDVTKLKETCQSATCFLVATLLDPMAHKIIVIVDPRYEANATANADSGDNTPAETIVSEIININVQDCTKAVNINQIQKKNRGDILVYSEKSTISVTNANQSFIKENAKNIIPKLNKNLLIVSTLPRREKKFIQMAPMKINGNAIIETFRLNQTTHRTVLVIMVPIFDQRITANADVRERIHVHTNANTSTETTFELCNIVVIKTQLQKDLRTDDVNLFNKLLNHQLVNDETACSK